MGFASGGVSFRRYQISGWRAGGMDDDAVAALKALAFGSLRETSADGTEVGWIAPTHLFDSEIELDKITVGRFVHLAMRLDRLGAPPAVVRSYQRMEEAAALAVSGKEFLSKKQRREAKEAAQARAEKEAQAGSFRRIAAHPLVIDLEERIVYFSSLGNGPHEKLLALFAKTFNARLTPLDASEQAGRIAEQHGWSRFFDDAEPVHLTDSPTGDAGNGFDDHDRSFLGREFLTWLWHTTETGDGTVSLAGDGRTALPGDVSVMLSKSLQLDCDFHATGRTGVYTDGPTLAPEARAAMAIGKQPTKTGLVLAAGPEQYTLGFDAVRFSVSGLRLPEIEEPSPTARLEERYLLITRCSAILNALYAAFLKDRLSGRYAPKLGELRSWARSGAGSGAPDPALRIAR